ncbi:hypothetical protein F4808DRAFT_474944 [Astrocystis sublimbata]|nr:hypothetical protein F4808DRAFT_474944 [Astrocystis sublimbata]
MGNSLTKEERAAQQQGAAGELGGSGNPGSSRHGESSTGRRAGRHDPSSLSAALAGASSSSSRQQQDVPFERRETRQEREARKLEKERQARLKERERSMNVKQEHVDGGYLVTLGIYSAAEDYSKPIVRQLQIERKIAPFWRGLDDFKDTWTEHQIIAAARGLEIPPADVVPEHLVSQPRPSAHSPDPSSSNLHNLTVPMGSRTLSASSDRVASHTGSVIPTAPSSSAHRTVSPLKQPKKALAAALNLSRNSSQADIAPQEINLTNDPFVNGQALEVFLYKKGEECPLCIMYYPPYLNRTRCCCQLICSECFVQIKRPDPHYPDHHGEGGPTAEGSQTSPGEPNEPNEPLIMEPAKCPYCTQSEFGVTYEPPPFRRGLTYAFPPSSLGAASTAMSSTSSVNLTLSPTTAQSARPSRARAQSLSANAPGVVTTDRIRPDWSTKLHTALSHQRRRAAAADALHHAAFMMGSQEPRTFFGRPSRFSRWNTGNRGSETPGTSSNIHHGGPVDAPPAHESGSARTGPPRGDRIDANQLESLMMAEAIRLSLADEEERRKKSDKEAKKEAKKREKEERKAAKKRGEVYGSGSGSGSTISLNLPFGRRRGDSSPGNLRVDPGAAVAPHGSVPGSPASDKGKGVERSPTEEASTTAATAGGSSTLPVPVSVPPRGSSHLRQMSNASSINSSDVDSMPGSYTGKVRGAEDQCSSHLGAQSDQGEISGSDEPMFNFRSLAAVVGVSIDGEGGPSGEGSQTQASKLEDSREAHGEHVEHVDHAADTTQRTLASATQESPPPDVIITPETPAPAGMDDGGSKQLGHSGEGESSHGLPQ